MDTYNSHISYCLTGQMSWGTQVCHFFRDREQLLEVLIPYFKTGLKNNELCFWIVPPSMSVKEAEREMEQALPDFSTYLKQGQMKIVSYETWDFEGGYKSFARAVHNVKSGLKECVEQNFSGTRTAVIFTSADKQLKKESAEFEKVFREAAGQYKVKAICSYSLDRFDTPEIVQTAFKHQRVLLKYKGMWEVFESYGLKNLEKELEEEKKLCAAIVDTTDNPVIILDSRGGIFRINQACEGLIGSSQEEVQGKNLWQVLPVSGEELDLARGAYEDLKAGKSIKIELNWVSKEGNKHLIKWSASPFWNRNGSLSFFIYTGVDITEQKQAERNLQERESQYQTLVETVPEIIIVINRGGKLIWTNLPGRDFFGEKFLQKSLQEYCLSKKKFREFHEALLPLFQGEEETATLETWLKSADGREKYLQWSCKLLKDQPEENVIAVARDVTQEYLAVTELKENTRLLKGVLDGIGDMVGVLEPDHSVLMYNRAGYELLGLSQEQVKGRKCFQLLGRQNKCEDCLVSQVITKKKPGAKEKYIPEWEKYIDCRAYPIQDEKGQIKYIVEQLRDITGHKRAEQELRNSEDRFRTIFERAAMGIAMCDLEGRTMVCNPALQKILGYSEEELLGNPLDSFTCPEDMDKKQELIRDLVSGKRDYFSMEKRYLHKGGYPVWVRLSLALVRDPEGNPQLTIGMVEDITEKKSTEEALRNSEQRYRLLVERLPDAVLILQGKKIVFANQAAAGLSGMNRPEDLINKEVKDVLSQEFLQEYWEEIEEALKQGIEMSLLVEQLPFHKGNVVDVEILLEPMNYQGTPSLLVVLRNVTQRNKMDEEFFKASKLESLGLLAGGIAHDFNNILAIILGNISLARLYQNQEQKEKISLKLKEIEKAAVLAKDLTRQLHTFARGGEPVTQTVSVKELVQDTTMLILSGSNVRSEFSFPKNLYSVEVDAGQIRQVINNLIINALQAMPEGGTIYVGAENVSIDNSRMENRIPLENGHYVRVFIRDEGMGIPREHQQRIFDPFFTTKEKGSGLGLATSYSIVKKHGGYITLNSQVGEGAIFFIYLPASPEVNEEEKRKEKHGGAKGRVLVMDDEDKLREVVGEMLSLIGFEAVFARDGEEAVDLYQRNLEIGKTFDAVMIDLTIPGGMGGKHTVQKLLEIDPRVKAFVTSGYYDDPVVSQFEKHGFAGFVPKPYKIEDLARVMAELQKG